MLMYLPLVMALCYSLMGDSGMAYSYTGAIIISTLHLGIAFLKQFTTTEENNSKHTTKH